jgi:hypothetical protein
MIISASRRTDLPAFFPKETIEKIISLNNSEQKTLFEKNTVDAVVFWTKNAKPIIPYLTELDDLKIPYYFQYTVNDYPGLEPNIPSYWERIESFMNLSEILGKHRVIWRYDPFLTSDAPVEYNIDDVLKRFIFVGTCLHLHTEKLVFSFLDMYDKIPMGLYTPNPEERVKIINKIIDIYPIWGIKVATCAEVAHDNPKIEINRCIDPILLKRLGVENIVDKKDRSQRQLCNCIPSLDIGIYHTCKHNCLYCYAK